MAAAIDEGFGFTLAGASSVLSGKVRSVNWTGVERNALNTTHAATSSGYMTFQASDMVDYGAWEAEGLYEPDTAPDITDAAETWTLTFPQAASQATSPVNIQATGFLTSFSAGVPYDDMMTFQSTTKLSGNITVTASA